MTSIRPTFLADAAKYYKGEDYQAEAFKWLQSQISDALLEKFATEFSPPQTEQKMVDINDKKAVQEQLVRIGLLDPPVDGKWGSLSESAARAAARVVGTDGALTQAALDRVCKLPSFKDLKFKAKDLNDKENLLAFMIVDRMVKLGFHLTVSMGSDSPAYNIVYAAGINADGTLNNNKIDEWNDLRFLIEVAQDGTVIKHGCWSATIDAGWYWRGSRRMNSDGALQIDMDKQFLGTSCVGRHGAKQYPALVQCGEITGTRDRLGDGRTNDDTHVTGNFGSNDHHGWDSELVGINSAGCCVGRYVAGHQKFMALLYLDRRYKCNNGFAWNRNILSGKNI